MCSYWRCRFFPVIGVWLCTTRFHSWSITIYVPNVPFYINDIVTCSNILKCILFADDINLVFVNMVGRLYRAKRITAFVALDWLNECDILAPSKWWVGWSQYWIVRQLQHFLLKTCQPIKWFKKCRSEEVP